MTAAEYRPAILTCSGCSLTQSTAVVMSARRAEWMEVG